MNLYQIYLAGGMQGLTFDQMNGWRVTIKNKINELLDNAGSLFVPVFVNPVDYYNFEHKNQKTNREVMEFDINKVKSSKLVIVDFTQNPNSIATSMEIAIARDNGIPVIGVYEPLANKEHKELHPWLYEACTRLCESYDELAEHIVNFYLT